MSVVDSVDQYPRFRKTLRELRSQFLLRTYEATPEDFEQISDEDLKCEYVDGELIVHSPATLEHEDLTIFTASLLREFVAPRRLGRVFGSNALMQLGERRFCPDVSVLLNEHESRIGDGRVHGPMDLVVEVISRSTRDYDHQTKLPAYREGGVGEIWFLDRERRQFDVHARRNGGYTIHVLTTGRWDSVALPGFSLLVDWFWQNPLPAVADCRID